MLGYDPDGTRTHNLFLRREAPYPLGHRARHAHFVMEKQYISSTQHNRRSLYVYNGNAVITVGSMVGQNIITNVLNMTDILLLFSPFSSNSAAVC